MYRCPTQDSCPAAQIKAAKLPSCHVPVPYSGQLPSCTNKSCQAVMYRYPTQDSCPAAQIKAAKLSCTGTLLRTANVRLMYELRVKSLVIFLLPDPITEVESVGYPKKCSDGYSSVCGVPQRFIQF